MLCFPFLCEISVIGHVWPWETSTSELELWYLLKKCNNNTRSASTPEMFRFFFFVVCCYSFTWLIFLTQFKLKSNWMPQSRLFCNSWLESPLTVVQGTLSSLFPHHETYCKIWKRQYNLHHIPCFDQNRPISIRLKSQNTGENKNAICSRTLYYIMFFPSLFPCCYSLVPSAPAGHILCSVKSWAIPLSQVLRSVLMKCSVLTLGEKADPRLCRSACSTWTGPCVCAHEKHGT